MRAFVSGALILALGSGCYATRETVRRTEKVLLVADAPTALVKVEDASGTRELTGLPQDVDVQYDASVRKFFWPSFIYPVFLGAVAALATSQWVPVMLADGDPTTVLPQLIIGSLAVPMAVGALVRCIVELGRDGDPWGDEKLLKPDFWGKVSELDQAAHDASAYSQVKVIATAPGFRTAVETLPRPPKRDQRVYLIPDAPLVAPAPQAPVVAPQAPAAGCGKDTDCKGERVCQQGVCVAPE